MSIQLTRTAFLAVVLCAGGAFAQNSETVESLSSRAIKRLQDQDCEESTRLARVILERQDATARERAEARYYLAVCAQRAGDGEAAAKELKELQTLLPSIPADYWLHREAAAIGQALKGAQQPAAPAADGVKREDIGYMIWQMRYANSQKQPAGAAERARAILADPRAGDDIRADALLHLYFAQRSLGEHEAAAKSLAEFEKIAPTLPASSTVPIEMALLRHALGDPNMEIPGKPAHTPAPDEYWRRAEPAEVGLDPVPIRDLEGHCRLSGADAFLIAKGGEVVSEWYSPLYREPMMTMSSVKSITGLVAGLLVAEGKLKVEDPVGNYLPQWTEGIRAEVTVEHLLTMSAGLSRMRTGGVAASGSQGMNAYVIGLEPTNEPGSKFEYTNEGAQLLSPVLEAAAGEPLWQYAQRRLFEPMGLNSTKFRLDGRGGTNTQADALTTLREFAKFGALVLHRGQWNGRPIIDEQWLGRMLTPSRTSKGYGYLWWLRENPRVWSMQGYLDTSVWVFPDLDIVVARVQSKPYLHALQAFSTDRMIELVQAAAK